MKLQRHKVDNDRGEWCLSEDVAELEAEIERLRAKLARYENEGTTHAEGCWAWGHKHYECALAEIERLKFGSGAKFIDSVGATRTSLDECRGKAAYVEIDGTIYWPLSEQDKERLIAAACGNGTFDGPSKAPPKPLRRAEEVMETGWYWNRLGGKDKGWIIVRVVRYGILDELHVMNSFGGYYPIKNMHGQQFIGPLTPPEM